jgi:peroxiredoxin
MITIKNQILIAFVLLLLGSPAFSQVKFDDPLTIIRDPDGKTLTKEDINDIMKSGKKFSMSSIKKGDTTVYHLKYLSEEDQKKSQNHKEDLIKQLEDNPLKPFSLKKMNGETVSESGIKGKVTVMNFWYTGCRPCIREMPDLNKLVDKYGETVNFLAPAFDTRDEVQAFLNKSEFKYESLPDSKTFNESLGINVYPTHLIIDKEGIVRKVIFGANDDIYEQIEEALNNLE